MYLEVKDVKKSYGQDGSYVQVLKGICTGVDKGKCASYREPVVPENPRC